MRVSRTKTRTTAVLVAVALILALAACDGTKTPTPTQSPLPTPAATTPPTDTPTPLPTLTPTPEPVAVQVEAESGKLSGEDLRVSFYADASDCYAVDTLDKGRPIDGVAGAMTYTVTVAVAGDYVLWGRAWGPDVSGNSWYVSVDDGPRALWDFDAYKQWTWELVRDREAGSIVYALVAGEHIVTFEPREDGARLDLFMLVSVDAIPVPDLVPCGVTPTPTVTPSSPLLTPTPQDSPLQTPAAAYELLCEGCEHVIVSGPVSQFVDVEVRQGNVIVYAETIDTGLTGLDAPCVGVDGAFTPTVPGGITGTAWLRPYWHGENISVTVGNMVVPWQDRPMRVEGQEPDLRGFYLWGELDAEPAAANAWAQGMVVVVSLWIGLLLICRMVVEIVKCIMKV